MVVGEGVCPGRRLVMFEPATPWGGFRTRGPSSPLVPNRAFYPYTAMHLSLSITLPTPHPPGCRTASGGVEGEGKREVLKAATVVTERVMGGRVRV